MYEDGEYVFTIIAEDIQANETIIDVEYNIVNSAGGVNFIKVSNEVESIITQDLTGSEAYQVLARPVDSMIQLELFINGDAAIFDEETGLWALDVNLTPGTNNIVAELRDELGNNSFTTLQVLYDAVDPVITHLPTSALTLPNASNESSFEQCRETRIGATDIPHFCLSTDKLIRQADHPIDNTLLDEGYTVFAVSINDPSQNTQVFTDISELTVEYRYSVAGELIQDWRKPARVNPNSREIYLPLTTDLLAIEYLSMGVADAHELEVRVTDNVFRSSSIKYSFNISVFPLQLLPSSPVLLEGIDTRFVNRDLLNSRDLIYEYRVQKLISFRSNIQIYYT